MHVSMWFEFFGGLFDVKNPWYMGGKCDNKEGDLTILLTNNIYSSFLA